MAEAPEMPLDEFERTLRRHGELCSGKLAVTGFLDFAKGGWAHTYECPACGAYASVARSTRNSPQTQDIGGGVLASE